MSTTIRVTWVRRAEAYRIDEVGDGGVVRAEISPAWLCDEAFAEHLAGLVADYRGLGVSRGAVDDDPAGRFGCWSGDAGGGARSSCLGRRRVLSGVRTRGGLEQLAGAGS